MPITMEQALSIGGLKKCHLLAGKSGLSRHIHHVNSMEIPDIRSWLSHGELLVTTGYAIKEPQKEIVALIRDLHAADAVGLAIKTRFTGPLPPSAIDEAERLGIPLLEIPSDMLFVNIVTPLVKAIVDDQNARLEYSEIIHSKFIELELSGGGFDGIANMLCSLLHLPIGIVDLDFNLHALQVSDHILSGVNKIKNFCAYYSENKASLPFYTGEAIYIADSETEDFTYTLRRIHIKAQTQGYLILYHTDNPLSDMSDVILDHAATTIALEFSKNKALKEQALFMGNHFFLDILSDTIENEEECKQRASLLKWPSPPFRLLVFDVNHFSETIKGKPEEEIQELKEKVHHLIKGNLQKISSKATVIMKSDSFTCLVPTTVAKDAIVLLIQQICREVSKSVSFTLTAGISAPSASFTALKNAYSEARDAISIARLSARPTPFLFIEEARMEQSFMKVGNNTYIQKYVRTVISNLIAYDKQNGTYLFHTLQVFVDCMGIKTKAAEALYLHRNTLFHRLKKIETITGYDLACPHDFFLLGIALQMYPYILEESTTSE